MVGMHDTRIRWVHSGWTAPMGHLSGVVLVGRVRLPVVAQAIMSPARAAFHRLTILADMIVLLVSSTVLSKMMSRVFAICRFSTNFGDRIELHARLAMWWRSSWWKP